MKGKKIILCPNPNRDRGMEATKAAESILRSMGFETVVCSPFREQKDELFAGYDVRPLPQELKGADLLITFGGDGTILHLAKLVALNKIPVLGINMGGLGFVAELEVGELETLRRLKDWNFVAQTMVVCPICIHNMRFSSYVLSPEHVLTVELERNGRKPVYLFVDESRGFALRADDKVQIRRSRYVTSLVRLTERSFCEIFAQKMLPGGLNDEK